MCKLTHILCSILLNKNTSSKISKNILTSSQLIYSYSLHIYTMFLIVSHICSYQYHPLTVSLSGRTQTTRALIKMAVRRACKWFDGECCFLSNFRLNSPQKQWHHGMEQNCLFDYRSYSRLLSLITFISKTFSLTDNEMSFSPG